MIFCAKNRRQRAEKSFFESLSSVFWFKNDFSAFCSQFFNRKMLFLLFVHQRRCFQPFSRLSAIDDKQKMCTASKRLAIWEKRTKFGRKFQSFNTNTTQTWQSSSMKFPERSANTCLFPALRQRNALLRTSRYRLRSSSTNEAKIPASD